MDRAQYKQITWFLDMLIARQYDNHQILEKLNIAEIAIGAAAIIIGIAILWNQRKIKKQLRQLLEEQPAMGLSTDKNTNKMKVHFGNRQ